MMKVTLLDGRVLQMPFFMMPAYGYRARSVEIDERDAEMMRIMMTYNPAEFNVTLAQFLARFRRAT